MNVPRLRAPIVLVHGLFGFTQVRMGRWVLADYFRDIPRALRAAGNHVLIPWLSPTGGIAFRAAQLAAFLERKSQHEPVHLLGHSMGGLDARYLISRLGLDDRVLTLTTLGTPHRGTAFADWAQDRLVRLFDPLFSYFGLPRQAFRDLTTASCAEFNRQTPDSPRVRYFSVAGQHDRHGFNPAWKLTAPIVRRAEGPNDGIVSVASAHYGESCEVWDADHMNLVNWRGLGRSSRRNDRLPHYAALVRRLADEGF
jgi:triacylglycerol lipase